jgi:hypothetical protein
VRLARPAGRVILRARSAHVSPASHRERDWIPVIARLSLALTTIHLAGAAVAQDLAVEVAPFPGLAEATRPAALAETPDGRLWFVFHDRVQVHDGSTVVTVPMPVRADRPPPSRLRCIAVGDDGTVAIGTDRGVWRVAAGA